MGFRFERVGSGDFVQNLKYEGALGTKSWFHVVVFGKESKFFSIESEI